MADLSVVPVRGGNLDMKSSFDVGAGPTNGLDDVIRSLDDRAREGELDADEVRRVGFFEDWENIVLGDERYDGWTRNEAGGVITATCDKAELAKIIAAMDALAREADTPRWAELTTFLRKAAEKGGTIALWYDAEG
jgi:hypothetical protein